MARNTDQLDFLDRAEAMRRERRMREALETVERSLKERPNHPRALLLRCRILYELGSLPQALDGLRALGRVIGSRELQPIVAALDLLETKRDLPAAPAFATESMARLLAQQGYFLEAMEIYRRLFESTSDKGGLWDEMARLRTSLEREGSRGAGKEKVTRELEACDRWLKEHRRGS